MPTAVSEFRAIKKHAETIVNDATHTIATMSPGDCWAQGDLLIVCLEGVPDGALPIKGMSQLAPGTSQGSRHTLKCLEAVAMFTMPKGTALDGPVFSAPAGCEIEHPEHGNVVLPPGTYGVIYQRQYAEELRRVLD